MKTTLLSFVALIACAFGGIAQNVHVPDLIFKNYLVSNPAINTNGDDEIQESEAIAFTGTIDCRDSEISDLTGIEAFTALTTLICKDNELVTLDLTQNTALTFLWCSFNYLTNLYLPQGTALTDVNCSVNDLTTIDVSQNPGLIDLNCSKNELTILDVSQNQALTTLSCGSNDLANLDVTQNPALVNLSCAYNDLTTIDLSQNPVLEKLTCFDNALTDLDLTQNPVFTSLSCPNNFITKLDLSQNPLLLLVICMNNSLTSLNVANGNNTLIYSFAAKDNPDLACIVVDDVAWSIANWTAPANIDITASFNTFCEDSVGVGVEEQTPINLSIYPNPASSQLTIDTQDQVESIAIYNLMGALVQTETTLSFSVTDLANGIYILKLRTNTGTVNKRFVKN